MKCRTCYSALRMIDKLVYTRAVTRYSKTVLRVFGRLVYTCAVTRYSTLGLLWA